MQVIPIVKAYNGEVKQQKKHLHEMNDKLRE